MEDNKQRAQNPVADNDNRRQNDEAEDDSFIRLDKVVFSIAAVIGRKIAREHIKAANDNLLADNEDKG